MNWKELPRKLKTFATSSVNIVIAALKPGLRTKKKEVDVEWWKEPAPTKTVEEHSEAVKAMQEHVDRPALRIRVLDIAIMLYITLDVVLVISLLASSQFSIFVLAYFIPGILMLLHYRQLLKEKKR